MTESGRSILKNRHAPETLSLLEAAADQFSDDSALLNAIAAWDERLTAVAKKFVSSSDDAAQREPLFDIEIGSVAPEAEERVIGLLRLEQRRRPILNHGSAAFALDKNAKVIVTNEMARDQLSLCDGQRFDDNMVDPLFRSVMPDLHAALSGTQSEVMSKIVRLGSGETGQTLFEARVTNPAGSDDPWIIFRKIGISLTIQGAQFVSEAFDLTESEIAVIRLIMDGCNTKVIATRRATAEATVRSQLKSIFAKTGTSGQTELLRIVSGISLFQASRQSNIRAKELPLLKQIESQKRLIRISGGHTIEIDESGDPFGKPFLSLHGLFLGYSFPSAAEGLLVSNGLRRIGLLRPGFGRSTPVDASDSIAAIVSKFIEVMDALNIEKCPRGGPRLWRRLCLRAGTSLSA
jgi:DNA-binding CsgD family transcriptional regulator